MAISVVQHNSNSASHTSGTSATDTATFSSSLTAGNCVVICFSIGSAFASPSITSVTTNGSSENWALAASQASTDFKTFIYVNPNTGGGQTVIDVAWSFGGTATSVNSAVIDIDIFEVSGLAASSVVDKTVTNTSTATTTSWTSTATATTTQASEIVFGVVGFDPTTATNATLTGPSSPWTNETQLNQILKIGSSSFPLNQMAGFNIVSSTGTQTYNGTSNTANSEYNAVVATLKASTGVSVSLTTAQENINALAVSIPRTINLTTAQVNINALPVIAGVVKSVALTTAQETISAYPLGLPKFVSLTTAQESIAAYPLGLPKFVNLPFGRQTIAAYPVGIQTAGPPISFSIVPLDTTDRYGNTTPAGFTVYNAHGVPVNRVTGNNGGGAGEFLYADTGSTSQGSLIASLASASGTDSLTGSAYPQGLKVTQGTISGTTFSGSDFIINNSGAFFYSSTPAFGNLIASIASTAGTDSFGNAYLQGFATYVSTNQYVQLSSTTASVNLQGVTSMSSPAFVGTQNVSGQMVLTTGELTNTDTSANIVLDSNQENSNQGALIWLEGAQVNIGQSGNMIWTESNGQLNFLNSGAGPFILNEGFHTISNASGVSGTLRVKMLPWNMVHIDMRCTFSYSGSSQTFTFGSLPSASYYPNSTLQLPLSIGGTPSGITSVYPRLQIGTSGAVQAFVPSGTGSNINLMLSTQYPIN